MPEKSAQIPPKRVNQSASNIARQQVQKPNPIKCILQIQTSKLKRFVLLVY